ncbi:MAG: PD40 domain-containing protein [Acidobacteria bacterium]|nr:PD40 domain-containing protein [Acidobacteriota bacterium]
MYVGTLDLATGESLAPPEQIGRFTGENYGPDWSPDGQYLAYVSRRDPVPSTGFESSGWVLVIRSVETGEERELPLKLTTKAFRPRWSPDGGSLLATARDHKGRQGVYRIDAQTGEVKPIVQMGPEATTSWADWSPDGKAIFYVSSDHASRRARVLMRNLETGQEKEIARGLAFNWAGSVLRSPDGWQLALRESLRGGLKVISATGESRELLRFSQEEQEQGIRIGGVAWMPDGRHLLFEKGPRGNMELWRISPDGGEPEKLGRPMGELGLGGLSVHPDGQRIAFSSGGRGDGGSELWVMENFLPELEDHSGR